MPVKADFLHIKHKSININLDYASRIKHIKIHIHWFRIYIFLGRKKLGMWSSSFPSFLPSCLPSIWKVVAEPRKTGILGLWRRRIQSGARDRLDCSGLLCNRVLLKCKRDRESFWHRHQKGAERVPPASVSNGAIYLLVSYYNESKECLKFVTVLPDPLPQFTF